MTKQPFNSCCLHVRFPFLLQPPTTNLTPNNPTNQKSLLPSPPNHPPNPSLLCRADEEAALRQSLVFTEDTADRESTPSHGASVYNTTTIPVATTTNNNYQRRGSYSPIDSNSQTSSLATINTDGGGAELARGDPNELGIPNTSIHRWLPKAQRSLLQKQAELFVKPAAPRAMQPNINNADRNGSSDQMTSRKENVAEVVEMTNGNGVVGNSTDQTLSEPPLRKMQETDIF